MAWNKKKLLDSYLAGWAKLQQDEVGYTESKIDQDFKSDLLSWFNTHSGILVGEVIPIVVEYLRNNPAVDFINEYEYLLVDEFQDLNKSEQEFIKLIRGKSNLVIVGDDDQSIYGFKYAHPQGIQQVDILFGNFEDVPFDVCRRCPTTVTQMASTLISLNPNRTLGALIPYQNNPEGIVDIVQWSNYNSEMIGLSQFIVSELTKGVLEPSDILILSPRRKIGYRLRDLLLGASVPVKSYFRESVIEKAHVQRSFSLLNFLANPEDKISLRFLLGYDSPDFRRNQYSILSQLATEKNLSTKETLDAILRNELPETNLRSIVSTYRNIIADVPNLKRAIIEDPINGFHNFFVTNPAQEDDFYELEQVYRNVINDVGVEIINESEENFNEWIKEITQSILETIALPDSPENIDHVRIMSLHSSKGLSAKLVILTSMIDPLIPFVPTTIEASDLEQVIQEARRLFYVAITRCKSTDSYEGRLVISSFLSIPGIEALQMGINAIPQTDLRTMTTRFVTDFGRTSPTPIRGDELI